MALGGGLADQVAVEILGNIAAMESAIELATKSEAFGLEDLLTIHRTLMLRSSTPELGGQIRREQNWIGGSSYNPCRAAFVPPPPDRLDALLRALAAGAGGDRSRPVRDAAPFADGNGMTGRALIHVILRQRNVGRQRDRVFEASRVLDLFTGLERALASPSGDILTARPNRAVPGKPKSE